MATGRETKLTGATGEYLVAAELCRFGLVAAPFAGNVPHYDVIASDPSGGHLAVQVKTIRGSSWQFDVRSFLDVELDNGGRQVIGRAKPEPYPRLACVLVALKNDTSGTSDRFFVLPWRKLRAIGSGGDSCWHRDRNSFSRTAPARAAAPTWPSGSEPSKTRSACVR